MFIRKYYGSLQFLKKYQIVSTRSIAICIVGSGPAGFYCAQHLLKILPNSSVDIYEKLPIPYGLVRFGVAPDHPEVKNVINTFNKIGSDARVKFIGNVTLGKNIGLNDLKNAYNAVVLSYGADKDVKLEVPGEELNNVIPARRFVGWYNGLPEDQNLHINLDADTVAIVGQGNVAVDVARILLKSVDELKNTDITEPALCRLAESKVKTVRLIGRRGPLQVAFTIKEFREMLKLSNVQTIIDREMFKELGCLISDLPRPRKRLTELLIKASEEYQTGVQKDKTLYVDFLRSPAKFTGSESVNGIELSVNKLKKLPDIPAELQRVESTDQQEYIPCELVFRSVGYRSSKAEPGIPFHSATCIGNPRVLPGVYSAGWVCTGPTGVILTTMSNAFNTANIIYEDVKNGILNEDENKPGYEYVKSYLKKEGTVTVNWDGWKTIDDVEIRRGKDRNKPREKITDVDEMLKIGGSSD